MRPISSNTLQKGRRPRRQAKSAFSAFLACLALAVLLTGQAAASPLRLPQTGNRPAAITPDPIVQGMLDQVQSANLYNYVAGLSGEQPVTIGGASFTLATRATSAATYIEKATQYAYEHFQSLGLAVSYHTWQYQTSTRRNVVADQPGTDPGCLYLLTAHLDDTSTSPNTLAPGADDNASGATGVLTAADILSHYHFTCSLRYVLFTGEEQGLLGSAAYAQLAAQRGDPILGVLNLDMIAYNSDSTTTIEMDIRTGQAGNPDRVLTNMVGDVILAYHISLTPLVYDSSDAGSDQYSFWEQGYPAVEVIEDWNDHTPYYHKTTDRVGTLDMAYFTDYVKAILGASAHLAQVIPAPPLTIQFYTPYVKR